MEMEADRKMGMPTLLAPVSAALGDCPVAPANQHHDCLSGDVTPEQPYVLLHVSIMAERRCGNSAIGAWVLVPMSTCPLSHFLVPVSEPSSLAHLVRSPSLVCHRPMYMLT